jgi:hypothetical protein
MCYAAPTILFTSFPIRKCDERSSRGKTQQLDKKKGGLCDSSLDLCASFDYKHLRAWV